MRKIAEAALFRTLAIGLHVFVLTDWPESGAEAAGMGGQSLVTLAGSTEQIETMVAEWTRPPEVARTLRIDPPAVQVQPDLLPMVTVRMDDAPNAELKMAALRAPQPPPGAAPGHGLGAAAIVASGRARGRASGEIRCQTKAPAPQTAANGGRTRPRCQTRIARVRPAQGGRIGRLVPGRKQGWCRNRVGLARAAGQAGRHLGRPHPRAGRTAHAPDKRPRRGHVAGDRRPQRTIAERFGPTLLGPTEAGRRRRRGGAARRPFSGCAQGSDTAELQLFAARQVRAMTLTAPPLRPRFTPSSRASRERQSAECGFR